MFNLQLVLIFCLFHGCWFWPMSWITPGQDSHVSPCSCFAKYHTKQQCNGWMCNFLICEAFENIRNVIYLPYWTDTHVLSVVSYCYQHCISLHNVWTLFSKIALSNSFVHCLVKLATIVNLIQLSFAKWISWLTCEHSCFIFRRSWDSFLCLEGGYTDKFSMVFVSSWAKC